MNSVEIGAQFSRMWDIRLIQNIVEFDDESSLCKWKDEEVFVFCLSGANWEKI